MAGCFTMQYQTLIVGILALLGVIATLAWNARLARRQHDRQVQHERAVVRVALRAELQEIAAAYRHRIETLEVDEGRFEGTRLPLDTMTDVYKSLIQRIGLLSETEVRAALR